MFHPLDSLGKFLEDENLLYLWSEKNKKSPYEYTPNSAKEVYWKCLDGKHEDYKRKINTSNTLSFRCPECSRERDESFLQEKVRLYLETLDYTILHEYNCDIIPINPKTNYKLPFDNEIKELKLIIEVHGEQHYKDSSGYFKDSFDLHKRQLYDRYKRIYTRSNGYNYLEIPYWTDDKDETWKKLINKKISEI